MSETTINTTLFTLTFDDVAIEDIGDTYVTSGLISDIAAFFQYKLVRNQLLIDDIEGNATPATDAVHTDGAQQPLTILTEGQEEFLDKLELQVDEYIEVIADLQVSYDAVNDNPQYKMLRKSNKVRKAEVKAYQQTKDDAGSIERAKQRVTAKLARENARNLRRAQREQRSAAIQ